MYLCSGLIGWLVVGWALEAWPWASPHFLQASSDHQLHVARLAIHLCTELAQNMQERGGCSAAARRGDGLLLQSQATFVGSLFFTSSLPACHGGCGPGIEANPEHACGW